MKKLLSIVLALCLCLTFTVSAFASEIPDSDSVLQEIDKTVAYLTNGVSGYGVNNATDYYYLSSISLAADDYFDGFVADVKQNLNNNGGRIVSAYGENLTTYAAVISILDLFGEDVFDFEGVDLVELMKATPLSSISNPYYYNIIIPTATIFGDEDYLKSVCDSFIDNYYVTGSGMNYWGFSCDNTAMFISAIAQSGMSDYEAVLEDALAVLETYKVEGGYCYNPAYGTEANTDSTAVALMAKSAYLLYQSEYTDDDLAEVTDLYEELLAFKGTAEGSYSYGGSDSAYATADALKGLDMYYLLVLTYEESQTPDYNPGFNLDDILGFLNGLFGGDSSEDPQVPTITPGENGDNNNNNNGTITDVEIPDTDANSGLAIFGIMALSAATAAVVAIKKKED